MLSCPFLQASLSAGKESNARADLEEVHWVHVRPPRFQKKNVSVKRILKFTNEIKNLNNLNFESIEMIKQKDTV